MLFVGFLVPQAVHTAHAAACAALSRELGIRVEPPSSAPLHLTIKAPFDTFGPLDQYAADRLDEMVTRRALRAISATTSAPCMLDDIARPRTSFVCLPVEGADLRASLDYLLDGFKSYAISVQDHEGKFPHISLVRNIRTPDRWGGALEVIANANFPRRIELDTIAVFSRGPDGWREFHRVVLPKHESAAA